jgi:hypothetical protein
LSGLSLRGWPGSRAIAGVPTAPSHASQVPCYVGERRSEKRGGDWGEGQRERWWLVIGRWG